MRRIQLCLLITIIGTSTIASLLPNVAAAQAARLRPIDRATVRIISVRGANATVVPGPNTGRRRVLADPNVSHGSGVAVGPRLIVTAAHVVTGAQHWAVIAAGRTEAMAAHPVVVHPELDIAVLEVDQRLPHTIRVPRVRTLSLSERLSASGYPLDVRETSPAAVTGELSRVTRNGQMHLAMTVNPGNSGGPIVDRRGRLVGILSARGRVAQGVEGLAIAVPLAPVVEMLRDLRRHRGERVAFTAADREVATSIPLFLSLTERPLDRSRLEATRLVRESLARDEPDAEADALVASLGWNVVMATLEQSNQIGPSANASEVADLQGQVIELAQRALRTGPHVRRGFPVLRAISYGRSALPPVQSTDGVERP